MFTGILLCGGKSRRMGRDKASLVLCGKPLLLWQADKLRTLGAGEVLLSGGTRPLPGTRLVPDLLPERGPLGGLHACLTAASFAYCLVLPVDAPLVPEPALRALLDAAQGHDGAYLQSPRGPEPLLAVYHRRLAPLAAQLLASGPAPARAARTSRPDRRTIHRRRSAASKLQHTRTVRRRTGAGRRSGQRLISSALAVKGRNQTDCGAAPHPDFRDSAYDLSDSQAARPLICMQIFHPHSTTCSNPHCNFRRVLG